MENLKTAYKDIATLLDVHLIEINKDIEHIFDRLDIETDDQEDIKDNLEDLLTDLEDKSQQYYDKALYKSLVK